MTTAQIRRRIERLERAATKTTEPDHGPLTFSASIAPLQSAITVASDGGARVKIDIPESEMPAIVRLMLYRGKVLQITITEMPQERTARRGKPRQLTEAEWGDDYGDEEEG